MKTIFKKSIWFTLTTTLCLVVATLLVFNGCEKLENPPKNYTNGIVVGYTKCNEDNNGTLIGLFIITEKKDSLLSFNVSLATIGIDPNSLNYGAYDIDGGNISFDYVLAVEKEIKQNFLCPQNHMLPGFSHGQIENYEQIIINDIK